MSVYDNSHRVNRRSIARRKHPHGKVVNLLCCLAWRVAVNSHRRFGGTRAMGGDYVF